MYIIFVNRIPKGGELLSKKEPTLHKNILLYIDKLLSINATVMVITNGKKTEVAYKLLDIMKHNPRFIVQLSTDEFHEPIDPVLRKRFADVGALNELTFIANQGSAKENNINTIAGGCACPVPTISPTGIVTKCACLDSDKLGMYNDPDTLVSLSNYFNSISKIHNNYVNVCGADISTEIKK